MRGEHRQQGYTGYNERQQGEENTDNDDKQGEESTGSRDTQATMTGSSERRVQVTTTGSR